MLIIQLKQVLHFIIGKDDFIMKKKIPDNSKPDKFDLANACSTNDCTGLITVPPEDEHELENYMDFYDFGPYDKNKKQ